MYEVIKECKRGADDKMILSKESGLVGCEDKELFVVSFLEYVPDDQYGDSYHVCTSEHFEALEDAELAFEVRKNSDNPYDASGFPTYIFDRSGSTLADILGAALKRRDETDK